MPDTFAFPAAPSRLPAEPRALSLTFSGTGAEYFRIWIVNLLLTIITFGIYSAWAKVRRLQYFDRNTVLDGAAFDFHGEPWAILKGRILALVMVLIYQVSIGFSVTAGAIVFCALLLILPWLLRGALRFRLHNTSWRGLRFRFTGTTQAAYLTFIPVMLLFMWPIIVAATMRQGDQPRPPSPWIGLVFLLGLAWPLMHAAVKRYQHAHIRLGGADSLYTLKSRRFWPPYLIAFALMFGVMAVIGIVTAVLLPLYAKTGGKSGTLVAVMTVTFIVAYLAALSAVPYLQSRLHNLVWSHTAFPGVTIVSDMTFGGLLKVQAVNLILTVLTLGLFRPFAVVRLLRYELEHMHVTASADIDALVDHDQSSDVSAAGEGAADFLGVDFAL